MFGYVEPDKPELKIREYEVFRGYYCSLCKTIGKRYGILPRLSLNYDLTFLYLLLSATDPAKGNGKMEPCIAHPLKKRFVVSSDVYAEYASDMNIILTYYSLQDKWVDEKNPVGKAGTIALKIPFKKAKKLHPEKCKYIESCLKKLSELEQNGCDSVDEAAEPFAAMMRELFECGHIKDEKQKKTLGWLGYNLGRWIYILDAWDDIEDDINKQNYNPILMQYNYKGESIPEFKIKIYNTVNFNLTYSLSEAEKAYSLLGIEKNKGRLDNILYSGLIVKTDKVLQGRGKVNEKESI